MQNGESKRLEKLIALAVAAALALNYPILHLFSGASFVFGLPLLYLYLFLVWVVVIACIGWVMSKHGPERDD